MLLLETMGHNDIGSIEETRESVALQLEGEDVLSLRSETLIIRDVTDLRHPPKQSLGSGTGLLRKAVEVVSGRVSPRRKRPQNPLRRTSKRNARQVYIDVNDQSQGVIKGMETRSMDEIHCSKPRCDGRIFPPPSSPATFSEA